MPKRVVVRSLARLALKVLLVVASLGGASFGPASCGVVSAQMPETIFQPGTQPGNVDGGIDVPVQGSRSCASCHGGYGGPDEDYGASDSWRGSLMGNAARDPVVRAALTIAEADHPAAADFCLRCHAPTAWLEGRSSLPEYASSNPDYPERLEPDIPTDDFATGVFSSDLDGVGCMLCHRMIDPGDPAMLGNAQFVLADGDEADQRRGPYRYDANQDPRHPTAFEPFESESAFCGTCHDISNPLLDGHRGAESTGAPMAIERTYSEWRFSAFASESDGQTCQDCHLREVAADASREGYFRERMSRHDLNGGNVWVPLALAERAAAVSEDAAELLRRSSSRARSLLQDSALLEIRDASLSEDGTASATIRVTNRTGHKLPTGYPEGRRMWLEVVIRDASRAVWSSGVLEGGHLPQDPQLRSYEVKLGQGEQESFHFILNDTLVSDTRIPPRGLVLPDERAVAEIAPLGRDYRDEDGSYRHWDDASYSVSNLCGEGTLTLTARLLFQTTTREYIEFLRDNQPPPSDDPALAGSTWGRIAYDAWERHGGDEPVVMEVAMRALGSARACPDAGPPDAGVRDAGTGARSDAGTGGSGSRDAATDGSGTREPGATEGSGCGVRLGPTHHARAVVLGMGALLALALLRRRPNRRLAQPFIRSMKR